MVVIELSVAAAHDNFSVHAVANVQVIDGASVREFDSKDTLLILNAGEADLLDSVGIDGAHSHS